MKLVIWTDKNGYKHRSLIRDNQMDSAAPEGIPQDPPDVNQLDWEEIKREIHNSLVEQGITSWSEVQRRGNAVGSTVASVIRPKLVGLYRQGG